MDHMTTSQHGGSAAMDSFSTILKVQGAAIHLDGLVGQDNASGKSSISSYRILCRDLSSVKTDQVQIFVMHGSGTITEKGAFHYQHPGGQPLEHDDLAIFITAPVPKHTQAAFAFDLGISQHSTSLEDLSKDIWRKIGTAFLYLEPQYSTSGAQRMPIVSANGNGYIGHLRAEYLVVKNPSAFNVEVPRPSWLDRFPAQLDAGHRGAGVGCRADLPGDIEENTIASFNYAHKHGAHMVELDVMCTLDGVPVVYHNYALANVKPGVSQIDQLTLAELRMVKNSGIHDKNCKHDLTGRTTNQDEHQQEQNSNHSRPFPTLAEVLHQVEPTCALNIELKWPQLLTNGKSEAQHYREVNDNVDRILDCIYEHSNGRAILLSSLNADIAIMMRLKQSQYPVLFLTTGDSKRFNDPITKTIKNAIHFAEAFSMAGINPNAATLTEHLVRYAHERGLLVYAWGKIETAQAIRELRRIGANGVIYDKIDLIKPQDEDWPIASANNQ